MMMLGHTANGKKSSKFEDSDSRMPRPRAVSELPQRPVQRLKSSAAVAPATEASAGTPRRALGGVRGTTAPRSPLHEKKPASACGGAGTGQRVGELEAKLERSHGQLQGMREQLAAARKDARAALVEASGVDERDDEEKSYNKDPVFEEANKISVRGGEEESNAVDDDDGNNKGSPDPEVEMLRAKLMTKDMEIYELRAKLMVIDTEVDDLRGKVMAKSTEVDELKAAVMSSDELVSRLTANLLVKDAEIAALEADNADLTKMADEAAEAEKSTAAMARETEHALRESAEREARLAERLRASELAREALEAEAQRSRVQREQWRKAAEEAAAVLALAGRGAVEKGTCDDKRRHRSASACAGGSDSMVAKDDDEEGASGKRKAGGTMRALSDLWKKKAQK